MKRRYGWLALAVLTLTAAMLAAAVSAAEIVASGYCGGEGDGTNLTWTLDSDGVLLIEGEGRMKDYTYYDDVPWRQYIDSLKKLVLGVGITHIGNYAFDCCYSFTGRLVLPESLTSIGSYAFYECYGFTGRLEIPEGVTEIGGCAFSECRGFTGSLILPTGMTQINDYTFYMCPSFNGELVLPEGVTDIGSYAFYNCSGFKGNLVIPDGVNEIGSEAFYFSGFTGNLILPDSLTNIGERAFSYCYGLSGDLILPDNLISIGSSAFCYCGFKGILKLPENLVKIEEDAFGSCYFSGNVIVPESVVSIGRGALDEFKSIYFQGDAPIAEYATANYSFDPKATLYYLESTSGWTDEEAIYDGLYDPETGLWRGYKIAPYSGRIPTRIDFAPGTKTEYQKGEYADNLQLVITYDDGTTATISEGFTQSPAADKALTVSYSEIKVTYQGMTAYLPITILVPRTVKRIDFAPDMKTEYRAGECLDDVEIIVTYSDGTTETLTEGFTQSIAADVPLTIGKQWLEVDYSGYGNSISIKVLGTNFAQKGTLYRNAYMPGDTMDYDGMYVNLEICEVGSFYSYTLYEDELAKYAPYTFTEADISDNFTLHVDLVYRGYTFPLEIPGLSVITGDSGVSLYDRPRKTSTATVLMAHYSNIEEALKGLESEEIEEACYNPILMLCEDQLLENISSDYQYVLGKYYDPCIDLNGHDLSLYKYNLWNVYATVTNTATETASLSYYDLKAGTETSLTVQKGEGLSGRIPGLYTLNLNAGAGGKIEVLSGSSSLDRNMVERGTTLYFSVTPNAGYGVASLNYSGSDISGYSLYGGTYNHYISNSSATSYTITATFVKLSADDPIDIPYDGPLAVEAGFAVGRVGERVCVPLSLSDNPGFTSLAVDISFDESVLTLERVIDTGLIPGSVQQSSLTSPYLLTWDNDLSQQDFCVNGAAAYLIFSIRPDAAVCETAVSLSIPDDGLTDRLGNDVPAVTNGNTVTVIDYLIGDVDSDGVVTPLDRMILARFLARMDGYTAEMVDALAADVNRDGVLTNRDRMILARYLAGWIGYEVLPYGAAAVPEN